MVEFTCKLINIANKKTSIRLADEEWCAFDIICVREHVKRDCLINLIEINKNAQMGLTYAVRLFSIIYFQDLFTKKSHQEYSSSKIKPVSPVFKAIRSIF
jgi:predicted DNA-binding ribbon-helix-helix protein